MYVLPIGPVAFFDVDSTLIWWNSQEDSDFIIEFEFNGHSLKRRYIIEHVQELILQKQSGTHIVVWSASGAQWAEAIVRALRIEEYVDVCMTKPHRLYDDKEPSEWLPKRRYFV